MISALLALVMATNDPTAILAADARQAAQMTMTLVTCEQFGYRVDHDEAERRFDAVAQRAKAAGLSDASIQSMRDAAMQDAIGASPLASIRQGDQEEIMSGWREVRGKVIAQCEALRAESETLLVPDPSRESVAMAFMSLQADVPLTNEGLFYLQAAGSCPAGRTRTEDALVVERIAAVLISYKPLIEPKIRQDLSDALSQGQAEAEEFTSAQCGRLLPRARSALRQGWEATEKTRGTPSPID